MKDQPFLHANNEDFDQNKLMPRLIQVISYWTITLLVFSGRGSFQLGVSSQSIAFIGPNVTWEVHTKGKIDIACLIDCLVVYKFTCNRYLITLEDCSFCQDSDFTAGSC